MAKAKGADNTNNYFMSAKEEPLIGAALVNWSFVAPHTALVTDDLFTDPELLTTWKAIKTNPTAGISAVPNNLTPRALQIVERYQGEEPSAVIRELTEARDERTLDTAADELLRKKPGEKPAERWARVQELVTKTSFTQLADEPTRWTPQTLAATDFPKPNWLIPNLLPAGITLLAGRPKCGKSWLALLWASRIKGNTIYAAYEDNARRLQSRTQALEIKNNNMILIPSPPWRMPEALTKLEGDINGYDYTTIIIDPWTYFAPTCRDNRRIYEVDYEAFAQLRRWSEEQGVSVLIIHHARKPTGRGGDFLDEPLGSTAYTGAVDTVAVLKKTSDREATLQMRGRDIEEKDLALTFDAGLWEIIGNASEVISEGARADIVAVLKREEKPLTPAEVANILDEPRNNVKAIMSKMFYADQVKRDSQGRYTPNTAMTAMTAADF